MHEIGIRAKVGSELWAKLFYKGSEQPGVGGGGVKMVETFPLEGSSEPRSAQTPSPPCQNKPDSRHQVFAKHLTHGEIGEYPEDMWQTRVMVMLGRYTEGKTEHHRIKSASASKS